MDIHKINKIAVDAGHAIMKFYKTEYQVDTKEDNSPLTAADMAAHEIIKTGLYALYSQIPVLSEEGDIPSREIRSKWDMFWLVDPLDGTKEFINKRGEFTVNIALISGHKPILGVIYVPAKDILYYAVADNGAWKQVGNGKPERIRVRGAQAEEESEEGPGAAASQSDRSLGAETEKESEDSPGVAASRPTRRLNLDTEEGLEEGPGVAASQSIRRLKLDTEKGLVVVASRLHSSKEDESFLSRFNIKEKISFGSSLKFCAVAEGTADIYPRFGPTCEWDTAAGQAIVEEAGGAVVDSSGEPFTYNKPSLKNGSFIAHSGKIAIF